MRFAVVTFLSVFCLCAQTSSTTPGGSVVGATPPASPMAVKPAPPSLSGPPKQVAPDTVVATVNGQKYTAAELSKLIAGLPPQYQMAVKNEPAKMLPNLFVMRYLTEIAEKDNLDKQSPYKEALDYNRETILANAEVTNERNKIAVTREEEKKFYDEHPDRFRQAKVKAIYVAFSPNAGKPDASKPDAAAKKPMTEAEAKAKIEDLRKQAAGGADFGKLAKENSDDKDSAAKDGDFPLVSLSSHYPAAVKDAIFAAKLGEMTEPVRQPNGFYLFKVQEASTLPYESVREKIFDELKQDRFNKFMEDLRKKYSVTIDSPDYFTASRFQVPPTAH